MSNKTDDPFIVRINKNRTSRNNDGSIFHEIVLSDGMKIYADPENHNYKNKWQILIENYKEVIGMYMHGLVKKNNNCYDCDAFPECYFDDDDNTTYNNLFE